jgi:hypothetical protein
VDLLTGGYLLESREPLGTLDPFAIWATLIPEGNAFFNAGATGALSLSAAGLANGEFAYLNAVSLPGSLGLFAAALVGLNLMQRRRGSRRTGLKPRWGSSRQESQSALRCR